MTVVEITRACPGWEEALPAGDTLLNDLTEAVLNRVGLAVAGGVDSMPEMEISVLLTDDGQIRELNRDYRDKDKPTNVLSFPSLDFDPDDPKSSLPPLETGQVLLLGDIIISLETVQKEAQSQEKGFTDHVSHLFVHGLLHLLGHDHMEEGEAERMEAIEIAILADRGIADPYGDGLVMED